MAPAEPAGHRDRPRRGRAPGIAAIALALFGTAGGARADEPGLQPDFVRRTAQLLADVVEREYMDAAVAAKVAAGLLERERKALEGAR
jgi:hypothetical protein